MSGLLYLDDSFYVSIIRALKGEAQSFRRTKNRSWLLEAYASRFLSTAAVLRNGGGEDGVERKVEIKKTRRSE